MNNGRDCPHGRQVGKCDTCDLIKTELELEKVEAEVKRLRSALQEIAQLQPRLMLDENQHEVICYNRRANPKSIAKAALESGGKLR